ncbi:MAG: peptidoglycan DD-metalloendopeptidase family protein [Actinomycetota bacterium]
MIWVGWPTPAAAGPVPPQLPSPQELAKLQSDMSATLNSVRAAQKQLDQVVRAYETAWSKMESLSAQIAATQAAIQALDSQLGVVRGSINARAASTYRSGPTGLMNVLMEARTYREFATAVDIIEAISSKDSETLNSVIQLRDKTAGLQAQLDAQRAEQQRTVGELERRQKQMQGSLRTLGKQYETAKAKFDDGKSGFVFPVKAPYSYVDSWGGARPGGRRHQGTDIFALKGTPVLAVVSGTLEQVGVNPLGGTKLWLRSPGDNWSYYYAHLNGYGPGVRNGAKVKKGQVLGYVGTTGNAVGTPPHLHFETHVPAGAATNPYPILKRVNPIK